MEEIKYKNYVKNPYNKFMEINYEEEQEDDKLNIINDEKIKNIINDFGNIDIDVTEFTQNIQNVMDLFSRSGGAAASAGSRGSGSGSKGSASGDKSK
jgi:hypothetical protein